VGRSEWGKSVPGVDVGGKSDLIIMRTDLGLSSIKTRLLCVICLCCGTMGDFEHDGDEEGGQKRGVFKINKTYEKVVKVV